MTAAKKRHSDENEDCSPPLQALRRAVAKAIDRHHKLGHPVCFLKDDKVYWLFPDGRELPDEECPGGELPGEGSPKL